ncbi:response regulator [Candidatus Sumerlaeota bacterium]|nr:response regulator [Candidatus Sumerlaeota bacterium]
MARNRILVVDDSESIRITLQLTLEFKGYVVTTAPSGEKGLELLRAGEYDLVFCDLAMPGIQGIDLIRATRTDLGLKDLPIVVLSAEERESKRSALEAGATQCIDKPFVPQQILKTAEQLLAAQ